MDMIRTAIIQSIAYAFPMTPCSEHYLANWDKMTLNVVKQNYRLPLGTGTAILREDKANLKFGLGCPSIAVEYNARCVAALTTSLNNEGKHGWITEALLESQLQQLKDHIFTSIDPTHQNPHFLTKQLNHMLR
eukprot:948366-Pelagomonas_calceolata.AAC.1